MTDAAATFDELIADATVRRLTDAEAAELVLAAATAALALAAAVAEHDGPALPGRPVPPRDRV